MADRTTPDGCFISRASLEKETPVSLLSQCNENGVFLTGFGQSILNLHPASACAGRNCVIHNPSDHSMRGFKTYWRDDRGIMERICPCGVGHPDPDDFAFHAANGREYMGIHGCDGCCAEPTKKHPRVYTPSAPLQR